MNSEPTPGGLPPVVMELVNQLSRFPGVGKKSALRMALYVMRSSREFAESCSAAIIAVKDRVSFCQTCWTFSEADPCPICMDLRRDHTRICVVEGPGDVIALEKAGGWDGVYHVLGGALAPLEGIGPDHLKLDQLVERLQRASVKEIVIATNPTPEGDTTALYIARLVKPLGVLVTRIARGVPVGSDLELADDTTLVQSLRGRSEIK